MLGKLFYSQAMSLPEFPVKSQVQTFYHTLLDLDRPPSSSFLLSSKPCQTSRRTANRVVRFYFDHWQPILLIVELLVNIYFLHHGPLHPIDYPTYLVQVRQIRLGERDYSKIYGPTGPLVYPGGHVVVFMFFERLFGIKGDDNWPGYVPAQWIFLALQLIQTCVSFLFLLPLLPLVIHLANRYGLGSPPDISNRVAVTSIGLSILPFNNTRQKRVSEWFIQ